LDNAVESLNLLTLWNHYFPCDTDSVGYATGIHIASFCLAGIFSDVIPGLDVSQKGETYRHN